MNQAESGRDAAATGFQARRAANLSCKSRERLWTHHPPHLSNAVAECGSAVTRAFPSQLVSTCIRPPYPMPRFRTFPRSSAGQQGFMQGFSMIRK